MQKTPQTPPPNKQQIFSYESFLQVQNLPSGKAEGYLFEQNL